MEKKRKDNFLIAFVFGAFIYSSDTNTPFVLTGKISDPMIVSKIISGKFRGLSPGIIIRKWECSVCHGDFEKCVHEIGQVYNGVKCEAIAKDIEFTEVSIVDHPQDARCRITDLLLIKEENNRRIYEWYGFKVNTENDRFRNIQKALQDGLIPENVAFYFSRFFSIQIEGKASYP